MTSFSSVAEVMVAEHAPLNGEFRSRLVVSSLTTGLDIGILMVVGRAAFQCIPFSLMMPIAFSILASVHSSRLATCGFLPFRAGIANKFDSLLRNNRAADLLLC